MSSYRGFALSKCMKKIQGKSFFVQVSAWFELAMVRVIESRLYANYPRSSRLCRLPLTRALDLFWLKRKNKRLLALYANFNRPILSLVINGRQPCIRSWIVTQFRVVAFYVVPILSLLVVSLSTLSSTFLSSFSSRLKLIVPLSFNAPDMEGNSNFQSAEVARENFFH